MEIKKSQLKKMFEEEGYYISDYILSKTYIAIKNILEDISVGQKVYSTCLDGPSGAGKTHFVDTYCKVASKLLGKRVKFINFQLDAETGKSDLYEDIDVVATFENDTSKIRIPGKIVEAIKAVNRGEYVILKMDEYDKARDVTDTFFNNFLQEALVNTTQHGDVYVDNKTSGKLQVFLCKNDLRAELSEPMMRRNRMIRLDYMTPERLHQILTDFASIYNSPAEVVNMVSLFYDEMYQNRDLYTKLPSCSECQQAIIDAQILLSDDDFTQNDIYINVIEDMLKMTDDINTFESLLSQEKTDSSKKLNSLVTKMKETATEPLENQEDLKTNMAVTVFEEEGKKLQDKIKEMQQLIDEYKEKFSVMEKQRQEAISAEVERISLKEGKLISSTYIPNVAPNFEDESANIKRGHSIFELSPENWTDVASLHIDGLNHHYLLEKIIENINELGVTVYENGISLKENGDLKLIVVRDLDEDNLPRYRFMASHPIIPATYLEDMVNFFNFANLANNHQPKTAKQTVNEALNMKMPNNYDINVLVYNDDDELALNFKSVAENIYHVENSGIVKDDTDYTILTTNVNCGNPENAITASNKIMTGYEKVKTNE